MKPIRTALASLAAAGLVIAQPALAAADVRAGSAVEESEGLAGGIASAAWPAVIAILLVGIVALVSAESDDDDFEPVSP
ncbi:hypothetical protein GRI75_12380 [Altererythrobacter soli]|uniref:Uncharacterized protein n=1 Tax=Croceibacterium soli TaxID=1739690 RepID=A0A6I4UUY0_9SPHN|nr:hypothetical protein [Croceibacterium soli]MXP42438.1 hypothetical protein [Croceibacterium soli]